jgi:hypothetical protein
MREEVIFQREIFEKDNFSRKRKSGFFPEMWKKKMGGKERDETTSYTEEVGSHGTVPGFLF